MITPDIIYLFQAQGEIELETGEKMTNPYMEVCYIDRLSTRDNTFKIECQFWEVGHRVSQSFEGVNTDPNGLSKLAIQTLVATDELLKKFTFIEAEDRSYHIALYIALRDGTDLPTKPSND